MAMTKKEKEALEAALTAAALRTTTDVAADVPPPSDSRDGLTKGWLPIAERSDYPRVEPACSSSVYHGRGQQNETTSQGARSLYSTKLLALKALRRAVEKHCADRLRAVDRMIEAESSNDQGNRPLPAKGE